MSRWIVTLVAIACACSKGGEPPPAPQPVGAEEQQLLRQCDAGTNAACEQLEALYLKARRHADSTALVKRLCESGRRYFCPTYAFVLTIGEDVPRDRARARQLFEDTCKDDPRACSEFGNLLLTGRGVPEDRELGCVVLRHACTHHDEDACRDLSYCAPGL